VTFSVWYCGDPSKVANYFRVPFKIIEIRFGELFYRPDFGSDDNTLVRGKIFMSERSSIDGMGVSMQQPQFVDLFLANQHRIYRFVASIVPQWVETEEIFQQTCLTLWERWDQFNPEGDFVHWGCGIAIGHLRNHVRKKQNHQIIFEELVLEQLALVHAEQHSQLEELHQALRECIEKLPADSRRIVLRCYDGQTSLKQAADQEGKTLNALYKLLRKVRNLLYDCVTRTVADWQAS